MRSLASIIPLILAAGDSTRMGYPKALLPFGNKTFIAHILDTVGGVGLAEPLIILGRGANGIRPVLEGMRAGIRINEDPDRGQLSSIQLGISSLPRDTEAAMIWPVDQPAVSKALVNRLAHSFIQSDCIMAFPKYGERRGHPAILHGSVFREFLEAPLEKGPKSIIQHHIQSIVEIQTAESAVVEDIDTPEEYEALTGESIAVALSRLNFLL